MSTPTPDDGNVYAEYVKSLLDYEQSRNDAIEAKASTIVTTSGILVTLLFGLVAVVTNAKSFQLPTDSHGWLTSAVILFVIATGLAVATPVIPFPYAQPIITPDSLANVWDYSASAARATVVATQLRQISNARQNNQRKSRLVGFAGTAELLALLTLATAVILIIGQSGR